MESSVIVSNRVTVVKIVSSDGKFDLRIMRSIYLVVVAYSLGNFFFFSLFDEIFRSKRIEIERWVKNKSKNNCVQTIERVIVLRGVFCGTKVEIHEMMGKKVKTKLPLKL